MTTEQQQRILELWQGWALQAREEGGDGVDVDPTLRFWGQVVQGDLALISVGLGELQGLLARECGDGNGV